MAQAPLAPFQESDFEALVALMHDETEGWEVAGDGEVKVWRRPDKKNKALIVMRASITVKDVDPEDLMAVWRNIEYRFTWDDRCAKNVCHSLLGDDPATQNEVGYYEGKAPPPLSNRDFVLQSGWRLRWRGEARWLYMNRSIEHPEFPEVKGCVRGVSFITGVHIEQKEDGQVTITYVTNGDVGGWIPKPVTNWVVTKAGKREVICLFFS
jgi:hypothetical protein